jgi:serine/threonine protein kinase
MTPLSFNLQIIMEYCSLGSLNDIMIVTGKTLSEVQIATVCKAMLEALHFMQKQAKIHRDIKPHNVLINKYGAAKLCTSLKALR